MCTIIGLIGILIYNSKKKEKRKETMKIIIIIIIKQEVIFREGFNMAQSQH
jgi:hypothetical protein